MSEYQKIETLYERDKDFVVIPGKFKNPIFEFTKNCAWRWTEKVDGTNIRIIYNPAIPGATAEDVLVNGAGASLDIRGRTDAASISARLMQWILKTITVEKLSAMFQAPTVLYGEGYGAGIQKGGYYVPKDEQKFILFDVRIDGKYWLGHDQVKAIADTLGIEMVPGFETMTIPEATEFVREGFESIVALRAGHPGFKAEGLVGRPEKTLYDGNLQRLIVKLKTRDFEPGKAKP